MPGKGQSSIFSVEHMVLITRPTLLWHEHLKLIYQLRYTSLYSRDVFKSRKLNTSQVKRMLKIQFPFSPEIQ